MERTRAKYRNDKKNGDIAARGQADESRGRRKRAVTNESDSRLYSEEEKETGGGKERLTPTPGAGGRPTMGKEQGGSQVGTVDPAPFFPAKLERKSKVRHISQAALPRQGADITWKGAAAL